MIETRIITDVTKDWLTTVDVKEALRVSFDDDNYYIKDIINAARKTIEKYCSISIGTQTLRTVMDCHAYEEYEIPYGPVQSITSVKLKENNTYTTNTTDYTNDGLEYKTFTPYIQGRWEINYTAGYSTIPTDLKGYWMRLVAYYYENRGETSTIPHELRRDLINYRRLYVL